MALEQWSVIALFIGLIGALLFSPIRPSAIFATAMLATLALGVVNSQELLRHAANPGVVTLLLLLSVSMALEKTRFLRRLAHRLIANTQSMTLLRLVGFTAITSAFLNNTAVVSSLLPSLRNNGMHPPSVLLMPLSYAAILGGTLTLIGTSTNLIVNSMLIDAGHPGFQFFDFLPIGLGVLLVCGAALLLLQRWLPVREMTRSEAKDYFLDAKVKTGSPLVGRTVLENGLRNMEALFLVEIVRQQRLISPVHPDEQIEAGDRLIFSGDVGKIGQLDAYPGLELFAESNGLLQQNLTEVVVTANANVVGKTLKSAGFRARFDAAVVAMRRDGEQISGKLGEVKLRAGDNLVLAVGNDFAERPNIRKNFFLLSEQNLPNQLSTRQEWLTLIGFVAVVAGAAAGLFSLLLGMLFLLALLLMTGALKREELQRRFPFDLWLIVTAALTLAQAFENSHLADMLADCVHHYLAEQSVFAAFVGIYLLAWAMTETMTNNAAAALSFPVAWGLANALGVDPLPFVLAVAFGASASFVSPYGYQTHLMVYNTGRYCIHDFVRIGLPIGVLYAATVLILLPVFFPF